MSGRKNGAVEILEDHDRDTDLLESTKGGEAGAAGVAEMASGVDDAEAKHRDGVDGAGRSNGVLREGCRRVREGTEMAVVEFDGDGRNSGARLEFGLGHREGVALGEKGVFGECFSFLLRSCLPEKETLHEAEEHWKDWVQIILYLTSFKNCPASMPGESKTSELVYTLPESEVAYKSGHLVQDWTICCTLLVFKTASATSTLRLFVLLMDKHTKIASEKRDQNKLQATMKGPVLGMKYPRSIVVCTLHHEILHNQRIYGTLNNKNDSLVLGYLCPTQFLRVSAQMFGERNVTKEDERRNKMHTPPPFFSERTLDQI
ncbi:hypothetical protein ZIOFF_064772 [Zingiber officinale]|uniref:Uncharacterized protein n=1 Tax=Zingiber officinale TaxID=94328 RepID=A0A8J5K6T0_ZINOF|nr:hypothetical protein ZIOFF_064772 [Zingiber officinale]